MGTCGWFELDCVAPELNIIRINDYIPHPCGINALELCSDYTSVLQADRSDLVLKCAMRCGWQLVGLAGGCSTFGDMRTTSSLPSFGSTTGPS